MVPVRAAFTRPVISFSNKFWFKASVILSLSKDQLPEDDAQIFQRLIPTQWIKTKFV
jgi:hypothetical protein